MNAGYTLLELLVAMSLSSLIMILLFNSYALIAKDYSQVKQYSDAITNSQYVLYFLKQYFNNHPKVSLFPIWQAQYPSLRLNSNSEGFGLIDNDSACRVYLYTSKNADNHPGLYFKENQKPRILIASKISSMQVIYAIKCPDSKNICSYSHSEQITDWRSVKGVALSFRVQIAPSIQKQLRSYFAIHEK